MQPHRSIIAACQNELLTAERTKRQRADSDVRLKFCLVKTWTGLVLSTMYRTMVYVAVGHCLDGEKKEFSILRLLYYIGTKLCIGVRIRVIYLAIRAKK